MTQAVLLGSSSRTEVCRLSDNDEDEDLLCVKLVSGWESVGLTLTSELGS